MAAVGKRILIGYDGTEPSRRALDRAAEIAGYGSSLTLVSVAQPYRNGGPTTPDRLLESRRLLDEARLELARRHVRADVLEPVGEPAAALVDAARELHADLVVLGTNDRGALGLLVHGSVSATVMREAPCDVLVVR